jgi:hypothetical protein
MKKVLDQLLLNNAQCKESFLDLQTASFEATDDFMHLEFKVGTDCTKYFFKHNPDKSKSEIVTLAIKQFCKIVKIPFAFFQKNRPGMKEKLVVAWKSSLGADKPKSEYLVKYRIHNNYPVIRAILPLNYVSIPNSAILEIIQGAFSDKYDISLISNLEKDEPKFHIRIIEDEKFLVGELEYSLGISLSCSELGASPLIIEAVLYNHAYETAQVITFGFEPCFIFDYVGIQPDQIKTIVPSVISRILLLKDSVREVLSQEAPFSGASETCRIIGKVKEVPSSFKKALYQEVKDCEEDMCTALDFSRHVSKIAKGYDIEKRIEIERVAGSLLNLNFEKI